MTRQQFGCSTAGSIVAWMALVALVGLCLHACAQQPLHKPGVEARSAEARNVVTAAPPAPANLACEAARADASGFTECEQLRLANIALQESGLQTQMQNLQMQDRMLEQQKAEFLGKVKAEHPGMAYEPPSQQFPLGRIAAPPPQAAQTHASPQRGKPMPRPAPAAK